jgi:hypothetical protein
LTFNGRIEKTQNCTPNDITVILVGALLSTGWLIVPRLSQSFAPQSPERISGRVVAPTADGGCQQFDFDNSSAMLASKGTIRCEYFIEHVQKPVSAPSVGATADPEKENDASERLKRIRDHFNVR